MSHFSILQNLINKTFPVSISRGSDNDETNVMEFTRRLETIGLILAHNVLKVGESVSLETESVGKSDKKGSLANDIKCCFLHFLVQITHHLVSSWVSILRY